MKATGKIIRVAQMIERNLAHACHQAHIEHDINTIGDLDADLAKGRTLRSH